MTLNFIYLLKFTGVILTLTLLRRPIIHLILRNNKRRNIILTLLSSLTRYLLLAGEFVGIMQAFGLNLYSLLAGAGIIGLILGLGLQGLFKDVWAGFAFLMEDTLNVGDYVVLNNQVIGYVEELGLHVLKLRAWDGQFITLRNSTITQVNNYNRGYMNLLLNVDLPALTPVATVETWMRTIVINLTSQLAEFTGESPKYLGLTQLVGTGCYRYIISCKVEARVYWQARYAAEAATLLYLQTQKAPLGACSTCSGTTLTNIIP